MFVVLLQPLASTELVLLALIVLPMAAWFAKRRTASLIRRARWLFLSIALLFVFATPGQRLPGMLGDIGITEDGILLAAEHVLRLLLLLATLAAVHERLGTTGVMAGLYWILAPLARWRALRERVVVRLMLVLDHVENAHSVVWRAWLSHEPAGPSSLYLSVGSMRAQDWGVLALLWALLYLAGTH